jgi:hypothetical protein
VLIFAADLSTLRSPFALLVGSRPEGMFVYMLPLPNFSLFSARHATVGLDPDDGMLFPGFRGSRGELFCKLANSPCILHRGLQRCCQYLPSFGTCVDKEYVDRSKTGSLNREFLNSVSVLASRIVR